VRNLIEVRLNFMIWSLFLKTVVRIIEGVFNLAIRGRVNRVNCKIGPTIEDIVDGSLSVGIVPSREALKSFSPYKLDSCRGGRVGSCGLC